MAGRTTIQRTFGLALVGLGLALMVSPAFCQISLQPKIGDPVPGLTSAELDLFLAGRALFDAPLEETDGLGPIFNQTSCGGCHNLPASGGAGTITVTRFGFDPDGNSFDPLTALGGSLLQAQAISDPCLETIPPQANVVTARTTPAVFGAGLIEAIPDAAILAHLASGGAEHLVSPLEDPTGPLRVGRFGWKAQVATVLTFSGDAALNEMGLTNRLVEQENAPNGDTILLMSCDSVSDPEDGPDGAGFDFIDRVTHFQRYLAAPPQTPRTGMTGEALFVATGCATCHVNSSYTTGVAPEAALSGVAIRPYSDFLLHDMGGLGDGIVQGDAGPTEMRTPALWGLRFRDSLLHDGSAAGGTFESRTSAAIVQHDGEGAAAAAAFSALGTFEQSQLVAFLDSLGRREFDHDGDNLVDDADFAVFFACFGSNDPVSADDPCAISDLDQDGDVDLIDFGFFLQAYEGAGTDCDSDGTIDIVELVEGTSLDCNGNAKSDSCDIASGTSNDSDLDGIPDECQIPIEWNVIWCTESAGGVVDSCGALFAALTALGEEIVIVTDITDPTQRPDPLPPGSAVWAQVGTYPANHQLSAAEGQALAELATAGVGIYIEGTDVWGFDPATTLTLVDGVEDTTVVDGDDTLSRLTGLSAGALDLSDLSGIDYIHDQPATNEWTDQILPTGTTPAEPIDLGGTNAHVAWQNDPDAAGETAYPVTVFYQPEEPFGVVIAQSWEFGGFGGDRTLLAALYRSVFDAPVENRFIRGDCNEDTTFDVSDAVFALAFLFSGGAAPTCVGSCDVNADSALDVSDAVSILATLFSGGPSPSAPFPECGTDPIPVGTTCASPSCP